MPKSRFEKELEIMHQQDFILDTRRNHLYRLGVNRDGYFTVTQTRFNNGVVIEPYIKQWGYNKLQAAIDKLNEIKNGLPKWEAIPSDTRLSFQLYG